MTPIKEKLQELGFTLEEINGNEWEAPPSWIRENIAAEKIREAIITNQFLSQKNEDTDNIFSFLSYISDCCWYCKRTIKEKLIIDFRLFDFFPDYFHFLLPIYRLFSNKEIDDIDLKKFIWKKFISYLLAEYIYERPVNYILSMEFFDTMNTVEEAWNGLAENASNNTPALLKLIKAGEFVPFNMKISVYKELIPCIETHINIFEYINKQFDNRKFYKDPDYYFAQKDYSTAIFILERLRIPTNHKKNYEELYNKLLKNK